MPALIQGNSQTLSFVDADSVTIQTGGGTATFECPIGTVVAVFSGTRTFGPFSNTTGKISAAVQDIYYETADGTGPASPLLYQSGLRPAVPGLGGAAVKRASGASGQGIKRVLVAGHSFATLHGRFETNTQPDLVRGYGSKGFAAWACMRINNRAQLLGHAGVSGELLSAFMLRLDAVIARAPDVCVLVHGLNDFSLSASARPVSAIFTDLVTVWEKMRAAGITPIATTVTPINSAYVGAHTARRSEVPLLNDLIVSYCAQNGIYCADMYNAVVNPLSATGEYATSNTYDDLHLSARGAWAASVPVAAILDRICPPRAGRINNSYDTRAVNAASNQLLNNPMLDGGASVATNWEVVTSTGSPTVTTSKVTLPDGTPGQRIQLSAAASASIVLRNSGNPLPTRLAAGEVYRGEMDVKIDVNSLCNRLSLDMIANVDSVDMSVFGTYQNDTNYDGITGSYTAFTRPLAMPASITTVNSAALGMYIGVAAGGSVDITLSRAELRRLPPSEVIAV